MLFSAAFVSSCDDGDDDENGNGDKPTSTVTNINETVQGVGSAQIASVKLLTDGVELATGTFTGGKMQITMPNTVLANLLSSISDIVSGEGDGIKVSNTNVRGLWEAYIAAFDNESKIGDFSFRNQNGYSAWLVYVNNDVTITGTDTRKGSTDVSDWAVSLKTGWNFIYSIENESANGYTVKHTTSKPNGMSWRFDPPESE